jgi:hypothetical protein
VKQFAGGIITLKTVMTGITGYMVRDKYPVTLLKSLNILPDIEDLTCHFMTKHAGSFLDPVPLHNIGSTNPARLHLYKNFMIRNGGNRSFLDSYIIVAVVNGYFHMEAGFKGTRIPGFEIYF